VPRSFAVGNFCTAPSLRRRLKRLGIGGLARADPRAAIVPPSPTARCRRAQADFLSHTQPAARIFPAARVLPQFSGTRKKSAPCPPPLPPACCACPFVDAKSAFWPSRSLSAPQPPPEKNRWEMKRPAGLGIRRRCGAPQGPRVARHYVVRASRSQRFEDRVRYRHRPVIQCARRRFVRSRRAGGKTISTGKRFR